MIGWLGWLSCLGRHLSNSYSGSEVLCSQNFFFFESTAICISDELIILLKHTGDVS